MRNWNKKIVSIGKEKEKNKETKLGEKTFTIDNDVMKWSKPRVTISIYNFFFSAKQFELSKVAKNNQTSENEQGR